MDERIEKAFEVANYMATLSNQRRIILEEYNHSLIYYINGATFKLTPSLISFVKTLIDIGNNENVVLIDDNNFPALIEDLDAFLNNITSKYLESVKTYADAFNALRAKRKIAGIVEL